MKKTIVTLSLSLVLALSLVACGGKKEDAKTDNTADSASVATSKEEKLERTEVTPSTEAEPETEKEPEITMMPVPANAYIDNAIKLDGFGIPSQDLKDYKYAFIPKSYIVPGETPYYVSTQHVFNEADNTLIYTCTVAPVEEAPANTPELTMIIDYDYIGFARNMNIGVYHAPNMLQNILQEDYAGPVEVLENTMTAPEGFTEDDFIDFMYGTISVKVPMSELDDQYITAYASTEWSSEGLYVAPQFEDFFVYK